MPPRGEAQARVVLEVQPSGVIGTHQLHAAVVLVVAEHDEELHVRLLARCVNGPQETLPTGPGPQAEVAHLVDGRNAGGSEFLEARGRAGDVAVPVPGEADAFFHRRSIEWRTDIAKLTQNPCDPREF